MRTLLSQLATARKSGLSWAGEKARSEMVSVGGLLSATSDLISPKALFVVALAALPKRPDMVRARSRVRDSRGEGNAKACCLKSLICSREEELVAPGKDYR